MKIIQKFKVLGLTLAFLALLDGMIATVLIWSEQTSRLESLVRYFDYGRSVPGKLEKWQESPGTPGNLYNVGWRSEIVSASVKAFRSEPYDASPVIRSYGMSFTNNILEKTVALDPTLNWDPHSGPGVPPNYTYALFHDDRANRRAGDIVVLGVLASSVPAMAALSNRTWVFEQPAPFTYPIYLPDGAGLARVDPLVASAADQRALAIDSEAQQALEDQFARHDLFHNPVSFWAPELDISPFVRLLRRSMAVAQIDQTTTKILEGDLYPFAQVLPSIVTDFARTARSDRQRPIVVLIQTGNPRDPDLLALLGDTLAAERIPYFATAEHYDPRDPAGFVADGHYRKHVDQMFAEVFLRLLQP